MRSLSDPRWTGVGAIAGIAGAIIALAALWQAIQHSPATIADQAARAGATHLVETSDQQPGAPAVAAPAADPVPHSSGAVASPLLPSRRIVCYYGNPNSTRMGVLGEYPREQMLRRLQGEVVRWTEIDPQRPALPCLQMIAVVAQSDPGPSGHFRAVMRDAQVDSVYQIARSIGGVFFIDVQPGTDDIRNLMPGFERLLSRPDVHFAIDPEFMMKGRARPGSRIGTIDAGDINYISGELARIVTRNNLPPKVLVVHRFTRNMVTNYQKIVHRPEVQIVVNMDGWGAPSLKREAYRDYVAGEPVQFTGFKIFYHNDTRRGDPLMTPQDLLSLEPAPLYVQYQ